MQKYQEGLEEKLRRSEFVFDLLHYNLHKISLNRGESYIHSPKWLNNKKATINPKNNNRKCFQYALTAALNMNKIKRILKEYLTLNPLLINKMGKK